MIIGPRMILLRPWQIDSEHKLLPGSTVIRVHKVDYASDVAEIDVSGILGSGELEVIFVPIREMREHLALE